jgi:hypothetical protein
MCEVCEIEIVLLKSVLQRVVDEINTGEANLTDLKLYIEEMLSDDRRV